MSLLSTTAVEVFHTFAEEIADRARVMSLKGFRRRLDVELKADESPVTVVDRNVETLLREAIHAAWPEHGIVGEEHGLSHLEAEYVWSIDPIDGTRSYITGWPLWGTLLALLHRGKPIFGLIDMPVLNERWVGISQGNSMLNGVITHTSTCTSLGQATLYATSPDIFDTTERDAFERVSALAQGRRFGGDCYSYALLASGHIDAVIEADLKPYDYLALAPVVEAAGGVLSDWQGRPLGLGSGGQVVAAATPELHQAILASLNQLDAVCPLESSYRRVNTTAHRSTA